jgi:hypothetical protein
MQGRAAGVAVTRDHGTRKTRILDRIHRISGIQKFRSGKISLILSEVRNHTPGLAFAILFLQTSQSVNHFGTAMPDFAAMNRS